MNAEERRKQGFYPDRSLDRAYEEMNRRKHPMNRIFIPPDERPSGRPFCDLCKRLMVYVKDMGYECPVCGAEYIDETKDPDRLRSKYAANPIFASKGNTSKAKRPTDFPQQAQIKRETEFLPDGSSRDIEYKT